MSRIQSVIAWLLLLIVLAVPLVAAAFSPQLNWRGPIYIAAGFAGIIGMILLLTQSLLAGRSLPGLSSVDSHRFHRLGGGLLLISVMIHIAGLWITSPPDMIDVLLFQSPTPFSKWGVLSFWALLAAALIAFFRKPMRLRPRIWRRTHFTLAAFGAVGCVLHAIQIEGTMELISKVVLAVLVLAATVKIGVELYKR